MSKQKWTQKDTREETEASRKETQRAFHAAREHARQSGELNDRPPEKKSKKDG